MRKFFAATMAAAMVMSMGAVSFAATSHIDAEAFGKALDYSGDSNKLKTSKDYELADGTKIYLNNMIEYGDTAYFPLIEDGAPMSAYDQVEKLKIKTEFEMGEDLVDSISIVKKSVDAVSGVSTAFDFAGVKITADMFDITSNVAVEWTTSSTNVDDCEVAVSNTSVDVNEDAVKAAVREMIAGKSIGTYFNGDVDVIADVIIAHLNTKTTKIATDIDAITTVSDFDFATANGVAIDDIGTWITANATDLAVGAANEVTAAIKADALDTTVGTAAAYDSTVQSSAASTAAANLGITASGTEISVGVDSDYYYFVAVKTKKVDTTSDSDVIGTFEFDRKLVKKNGAVIFPEIKDEKIDFAINLWYDGNYAAADATGTTPLKVDNEASLKWDDMYVLKFESDEEVTLNFGYENEGEFTVDVSGQGKLLVNFNTKANEAIADANPGVKMMFVNFNGAKFNRVGEFEYEMEDLAAAYQIVDDKLVALNSLEISNETATFYTRTLGNYVFADAELVNPVVEAPVVEAPAEVVTNPTTGVNA